MGFKNRKLGSSIIVGLKLIFESLDLDLTFFKRSRFDIFDVQAKAYVIADIIVSIKLLTEIDFHWQSIFFHLIIKIFQEKRFWSLIYRKE